MVSCREIVSLGHLVSRRNPDSNPAKNPAKNPDSNPAKNPDNNRASATIVVSPQRPPVITGPGDGTVCDGNVALTGRALPGATVDVYVDGVLVGNTTADAGGAWSYNITGLGNGAQQKAIRR